MKKFLLLCLASVFALSMAWAQELVVSGKVTSTEDGSALPGVNVVLKGTTNGTVTDADGNYRITVPSGSGSLVFSFIGLMTQEIAIGDRTTVDIQLSLDVTQLSEVVVTAVGIEREKKALGYSVATVSAQNLQQRSEVDPLRALQGKMAGVNIVGGGGAPGQSTRINIRGMSSLTGNTQPLFIVDGIPFDNSVNSNTTQGSNGEDAARNTVFSNRAFDLDPNNIESINILKGAAAAALYGSRATNGVVIVTTKSAKKGSRKGMEVNFASSLNFEEISGIPDYQDTYTQGSNQVYNGAFIGNWGSPFPDHVDAINSKYGTSYPKYYGVYTAGPQSGQNYPDGTGPHPYATRYPSLTEFQDANGQPLAVPIVPHDIIGEFFEKGRTTENALTISNGSEKMNMNVTISRMDQTGMIPNSGASRTAMSFGGNGQLDNGLIMSGNVNYVNTTQHSPPSGGSAFSDYFGGVNGDFAGAGSIYARLFYLPRNFDLNGYPFENAVNGNNLFYRALDNPRWITKYNQYTSNVNRVYGSINLGYDITEWLNVVLKGGVNTYTDRRKDIVRSGGILEPLGHVQNDDLTNTEQDYNLIFTVQKDFNEDFGFRGLFGGNANQRSFYRSRVTGTGIISDGPDGTGLYRLDATQSQIANSDYTSLRRLLALYADLSFSYKDYLFLNVGGRNDWSSTLPIENNNYFYPFANVSAVISDIVSMPEVIDMVKIRAAAAKVGRDADPYLTTTNYIIDVPFTTATGVKTNRATLQNTLGNPNLKPEFTTEYEAGFEANFLQNRISLDVTYFTRKSTDQIISAALPRTTGFTQQIINFGQLNNKGWEAALGLTPVKLANGLEWNMNIVYTRIRSLVVDAGPTGEIIVGGPGSSLATIHRNGEAYGQIYGTRNATAPDGTLLIDPNTGLPFFEQESAIVGNPNPDFTLGWNNTISFKGIVLRALIDWRQGGDFYSFTGASLLLRGELKQSADREALRVVPGILGNTQTYEPIMEGGSTVQNTIPITAFDSHFSNGWGAYGADETNIYDGTVIRLREISLGYSLPKSLLSKTPLGNVTVSVSGRNLWWNAPNVMTDLNLDPEVLGGTAGTNVQGFEYGSAPTTRRYGFNLNLTF